jgi:hypothetical protein
VLPFPQATVRAAISTAAASLVLRTNSKQRIVSRKSAYHKAYLPGATPNVKPAKPAELALTVTVAFEAVEPFRVMDAGDIEQVAPDGAPLQLSEMV